MSVDHATVLDTVPDRTVIHPTGIQSVYNNSALLRPDIPTEIHLCIADHLPIYSIACLILTCKTLLSIHGNRSWPSLKEPQSRSLGELSDFYILLERDLPEHYLPDHQATKLRRRQPSADNHHYKQNAYSALSLFNFSISWDQVVQALKRDKYGPDHGIPLDTFKHKTTIITPQSTTTPPLPFSVTTDFSTDARIVQGRFLLSVKYLISANTDNLSLATLKCLYMTLCRHMGTASRSSPWYDNTLAKQLSAARSASPSTQDSDGGPAQGREKLLLSGNCSLCMTDWTVEYVTFPLQQSSTTTTTTTTTTPPPSSTHQPPTPEPHHPSYPARSAYLITTHQNLGSCNSQHQARDPQNEIWKAFAGGPGFYGHLVRVLKYPRGCVREAFEGGEEEGWRLVGVEKGI
ncbi:hypothetical protein FB567DRAFT_77043 [Paraphoma chrysanthemicola]|uniref:F-box domain-containing protein n=1 Tax=Paraphoma chrysanthemicola TaxID=798071 RepID=A0A8K0R598_9PLEO|nr:hypothetical protein FB567DRAFT_77043 [Paraphoma chrysanthemicola]